MLPANPSEMMHVSEMLHGARALNAQSSPPERAMLRVPVREL